MKHAITTIACFLMLSACATIANAQTTTNITITPTSQVFDANNVSGVILDAAPGFASGSFASNGAGKTDMYFPPEAIFNREVTVGEIASISYWTKTGATHVVDPRDWYLTIYTKRYGGQLGTSFYGIRIGAEPYFSANLNDPAGAWNQWSSEGPANHLRFFESTYGYFGSYSDPHWDAFILGNSLAGSRGPGVPKATQPILFFSVQTGSGWASGFTGQLDGLRIELNDGSVAKINFEPFVEATNKNACKNDGWMSLYRADGSAFNNQGDCIQYVNTGK